MARTIRFHLDEHIPSGVVAGLRRRGIDVSTTAEAGLLNATDAQHIAYALQSNRVLVTHNDDFLILATEGTKHVGIAFCHQEARSIGEIIQGLVLIWEVLEPEQMHDHIEWI
jgi:predicted nuclease of predicted toxin-antitoxin system